MVKWLRCSARIYKILRSNVIILIYGMTLNKSLIAKLSRVIHSHRANVSPVSTLNGRGADTAVRKKERDGRNRLHVYPNNDHNWPQREISLREIIIIIIIVIIKICQLRVEQKRADHASLSLVNGSNTFIGQGDGGRPLHGASSEACVEFLSSAIHFTTVKYDEAESPKTSANSLVISVGLNPFRIKNLMTARYSIFEFFDVLKNNRYQSPLCLTKGKSYSNENWFIQI